MEDCADDQSSAMLNLINSEIARATDLLEIQRRSYDLCLESTIALQTRLDLRSKTSTGKCPMLGPLWFTH